MPAQSPVYIGTGSPPPPTEQVRAAQAVYKQNVELAVRNKTLSVLRNLYAVTTTSTNVPDGTQHIVDTIVKELGFVAALISLLDKEKKFLKTAAITRSAPIEESIRLIGKPLESIAISTENRNNLLVTALTERKQQVTGNLLDILTPHVTQEVADKIEAMTTIKTIIIYPLLFGERPLGTLTIGLAKQAENLSKAEQETLEELINVVAIAVDRAQLLEDLRDANKQLELLDKLKDEFVSVASHELRTPMTAIKSYAWMILNNKAGNIDPKARDYLDRVYNSTERLIHLVNEMLDVSRIESGRVQLKLESFDMVQLATDVEMEFQPRTLDKTLKLVVTHEGSNLKVQADREKIHQVLENLVGNAFKFTPAGGTITVHITRTDSMIEISVHDTGAGISKDDLPRLFTKFGRLENSLVTITGSGSGLGLYISKQYVEMHGGTIEVTSELEKGTTVTFTLPIAKN